MAVIEDAVSTAAAACDNWCSKGAAAAKGADNGCNGVAATSVAATDEPSGTDGAAASTAAHHTDGMGVFSSELRCVKIV